ncbi:response regulator transcription factor [Nocardia bovistercoris]|uniref:HTH luxR-type domain-containing protein n=1 Tax=Nocardia bovistercoris TaxID=2785916 RepID=A0A931IF14_9NOCA|nr:helix-turn-helix transcriptional regulator [Nocardia bovistercoris]MBH0779266.1 hypothetical protein [Nocardia bovistercoris]
MADESLSATRMYTEEPAATPPSAESAPELISDLLFMAATVETVEGLNPRILADLKCSTTALVRGDFPRALADLERLSVARDTSPEFDDHLTALRMLMLSQIDERRAYDVAAAVLHGAANRIASRAVALGIRANRSWTTGDLAAGLWQHQVAVHVSAAAAPIWRVHAQIMLAKRLVDLRIIDRADRLLSDLQSVIDRSGLHAFDSIPLALRAALHLQAGSPRKALRTAARAIEIATQHGTAAGVARALVISASAHLRLGEIAHAVEALGRMRSQPHYYALSDSVARAEFLEIEIAALDSGPRLASMRLRSSLYLIGAESACFAEDPSMAARLVRIAIQGGDMPLAEGVAAAATSIARRNPGLSALEVGSVHARGVLTYDRALLESALESSRDPYVRSRILADMGALPARRSARAAGSDAARPEISDLTDREREIAVLVGRGLTNRQVARQVGLTDHTVNFHLRKVYRKLEISSRAQLGQIIARAE